MPRQYILRDIPPDIWSRFSSRASEEGWPLRALILQLLDEYGARRIRHIGAPPEQMPIWAWLRPSFRHLARNPRFSELGFDDQWQALIEEVRRQRPSAASTLESALPDRRTQVLNWLQQTAVKDLSPEHVPLTLRAIAHIGSGPNLQHGRRVIQYEALGLPPGQAALIAESNGRWQVSRYFSEKPADVWADSFETAQEALLAIEEVVRNEAILAKNHGT